MLIYLGANIVQYCADYYAPGLRWATHPPDHKLKIIMVIVDAGAVFTRISGQNTKRE